MWLVVTCTWPDPSPALLGDTPPEAMYASPAVASMAVTTASAIFRRVLLTMIDPFSCLALSNEDRAGAGRARPGNALLALLRSYWLASMSTLPIVAMCHS